MDFITVSLPETILFSLRTLHCCREVLFLPQFLENASIFKMFIYLRQTDRQRQSRCVAVWKSEDFEGVGLFLRPCFEPRSLSFLSALCVFMDSWYSNILPILQSLTAFLLYESWGYQYMLPHLAFYVRSKDQTFIIPVAQESLWAMYRFFLYKFWESNLGHQGWETTLLAVLPIQLLLPFFTYIISLSHIP